MILVSGATGRVGGAIATELLNGEERVRAFVRRPESAAALAAVGADIAQGDFGDAASVRRAMSGVRCAILVPAAVPEQVAHESNFVDAAVEAGVERLVKISISAAGANAPIGVLRSHHEGEEKVKSSGLPYTIIRLVFLMQTVLTWAPFVAERGRFTTTAAPGEILAVVDARDAAACVAASVGPRFAGETYMVLAPGLVTFSQMAAALSEATGRDIRYVQGTVEELRDQMLRSGEPADAVDHVADHFATLDYVRMESITQVMALPHGMTAITDVTGRRPIEFRDFAVEYAEQFRSGVAARTP